VADRKGIRGLLVRCSRSPFAAVVAAVFVLHATGIGWGLPASDGWDDDGIAPRDFLFGALFTYWPGRFYTYPPAQLLLLALLTLPVSGFAAARARSFSPPDLIAAFIQIPTMTTFALVARLVTLVMSIGIVIALARFARIVSGRSASTWVAAVCGANAVLTYYSHTTNLDVPYLFWSSLALMFLARVLVEQRPRLLRSALLLMAMAIGTKDQAYSLFLIAVPACMALWLATTRFAREHRGEIAREFAIGAALSVCFLLVLDGAVVNPSGFAARLRFLFGTASQDHAYYSSTWSGISLVVRDSCLHFTRYYPIAFAPLFFLGAFRACAAWTRRSAPTVHDFRDVTEIPADRSSEGVRVAALLPLLYALSCTLAFTFVARRTEHRFLLPQMLFLGVYGGFGLDWLIARVGARLGRWNYALIACLFGPALYESVGVDAALLWDPRYDAERWLAGHVQSADVVETYGNNVYLPRFPSSERVIRVGPEPVDARNPLPTVREVQDDYEAVDQRRSRWIVVTETWVWRYMYNDAAAREPGRITSRQERLWESDTAACRFFAELHQGRRGYRLVHTSRWESSIWPRIDIHGSTTREVRIFEREDSGT
jgi:hypothetical protein